ncbi:MAG: sugar transferase [Hyphomicrobium sp.]|nr:sugar transferase [Hyphomicrobium sp.]
MLVLPPHTLDDPVGRTKGSSLPEACPTDFRPVGGLAKRCADVLLSSATLALLLPTFLIIAALIKLTSAGPIFFGHTRIGFGGRPFRCYKFRTMVRDSDTVLTELLSRSPAAAQEWALHRKLVDDPRVTAVGRFLRKSSLDELPQLFNIFIGDMSCVGPRPVTQNELHRYGRTINDYVRARPGLTGLWQVSGRNSVRYGRRVALDRVYVRHWSPLLDLAIILRTIPALLRTQQTS